MIHRPAKIVAATAFCVAALSALTTTAANAQSGAPAGRLSCHVGGALSLIVTSQKPMECRFTPRRGPVQRYTGVVRSFGLDVGSFKRSSMGWRVFGPYARAPLGALAGTYVGASAGASAGTGGSVNMLIGGVEKDVTLQPLSLQTLRGFNVAVGVTGLELTLAPSSSSPPPRGRR
ncbi:DUF992 domain-containing protein [Bosea sp. BIWAKO-01]|uniref:DUF992 domain-containing protein n=1 Tax=Bosea sp. BIWAKO-01 TaxID=506668 RepID=UPI0008530ED0|nr:DUF992 domain-containing protein [Bosea sp. BIWAKO-01]